MGIKDFQITVIRSEGSYNLNDYSDWFITGAAGLSIPANSRFIERAALQDGAFNMGLKLLPRYFDLNFTTFDNSEQNYWNTRDEIARIFLPSNELISILFTMGTTQRQIDCAIRGVPQANSENRFLYQQKWGIQFIAPDPLFYHPSRQTVSLGNWGGTGFVIPMTVPFDFGQSSVDQTTVINNIGSWNTYPEIQIIGPINNAVITNLTTGYKLDFTGLNLGSGNERIIDTSFEAKTVIDENGTNKISDLTNDSDLTLFSFLPGINSIKITGSSITTATQIFFRYYHRYIGI